MLIQALQNPTLYDHPIENFRVLETHGAWILLTGLFAYKIKKPVDFEFLDYSTLEKRKFCCEEEIRLNQTLASELYEKIIPITGTPEQPELDGSGTVIEYAIKMKEFPQKNLFSHLLKNHQLIPTLMDELAVIIADFHGKIPHATSEIIFGDPEHVYAPVQQNFDQIRPLITEHTQLDRLEKWASETYQILKPIFKQRKKSGYIRECHGDLYLNNIILWNDHPLIFDCIEFNESFRWTDTMADLGFLTMDLEDNQRSDYAHRVINQYLETSGDYDGLSVLRFYESYRAVVRAKIALFQSNHEAYIHYINLAEHYTNPTKPQLIITYGLSGSGKSTRARQVVEELGAIQIRSDIERKRLLGLNADSQTDSAVNKGIYTEEITDKTYQHLLQLARAILQSGYSVVVDATFLKNKHRVLFLNLATELNIPFKIEACSLPVELAKKRIAERKINPRNPSEAYPDVIVMQEATQEPLTEEELLYEK
jgi:aminoglycoside phosphotransferase family enzyme/predicted kinase